MSIRTQLQDFVHIEVIDPFLAFMHAAPSRKVQKALQAEIDSYYEGIAQVAKTNAAKAHITGDLKAQAFLGFEFSDAMVQQEAVKYAREYGKLLTDEGASIIQGKKVPWLRDANKKTRASITDILKQGLKEGKPVTDIGGKKAVEGTIAYDLKQYLGAEDARLTRIARTEIARFQSAGTLTRYKEAGVTQVKWLTADDPCPICAPYSNQIFDMKDLPEIPVHPQCRCAYAPVVASIKEGEPTSTKKPAPKKAPKELTKPEVIKEKRISINTDHANIKDDLNLHSVNAYESPLGKVKLTKREFEAASRYKSNEFTQINGSLRGSLKPPMKGLKTLVKDIDSGMAKSAMPRDVPVYRGISPRVSEQIMKTNVCENAGYTSTTFKPDYAFSFADRGSDGFMNVMQFEAKKGTNALMWPGYESEILLKRGLKLKCTGIKETANFVTKVDKAKGITRKKIRIFIMEVV